MEETMKVKELLLNTLAYVLIGIISFTGTITILQATLRTYYHYTRVGGTNDEIPKQLLKQWSEPGRKIVDREKYM